VDLHNPSGTPVVAAADGLVMVAGNDSKEAFGPISHYYGNLVILEHKFPGIDPPFFTLYGHLSKVEVHIGQVVEAGDEIGKVGSSGVAIGSHLHFEVRLGQNDYDSNRNPVLWLKPLTGSDGNLFGVIAGRLVDGQGKLIYTRDFTIQYFRDPQGPQTAVYGIETYAPEKHPVGKDDLWQENFSLGDLQAGEYRLTFVWKGKLFERWVEVQPGELTLVTFTVK
jgi:murein DD-endopeptidase MepM/ murein hydrolase activator NlpD